MLSFGFPLSPRNRSILISMAQSQSGGSPRHRSHRCLDSSGYGTLVEYAVYSSSGGSSAEFLHHEIDRLGFRVRSDPGLERLLRAEVQQSDEASMREALAARRTLRSVSVNKAQPTV